MFQKLGRLSSRSKDVFSSTETAWRRHKKTYAGHQMCNLVAQNAFLKDADVRLLAQHLTKHPTIKRVDLRGNRLRDLATFQALEKLAKDNSKLIEVMLDDENLSGSPYAAVKAMQKLLAKTRWSLASRGFLSKKTEKFGSFVTALMKNEKSEVSKSLGEDLVHKVARKSAEDFQRATREQCFSNTWSGSELMHGLFTAKKTASTKWQAQVQEGNKRRESIRQTTSEVAKETGVQFGIQSMVQLEQPSLLS